MAKEAQPLKPAAGPKTEDTAPNQDAPSVGTAGADQYLQDARGTTFGDNTSSSGGANNPGQHGRDGGQSVAVTEEAKKMDHNPAPSKNAVSGEAADNNQKEA